MNLNNLRLLSPKKKNILKKIFFFEKKPCLTRNHEEKLLTIYMVYTQVDLFNNKLIL